MEASGNSVVCYAGGGQYQRYVFHASWVDPNVLMVAVTTRRTRSMTCKFFWFEDETFRPMSEKDARLQSVFNSLRGYLLMVYK